MASYIGTLVVVALLAISVSCKKKKSSDINFDSLISGMDSAEQEMFREELQKEVKKFHIPRHSSSKKSSSTGSKRRKPKPKPSIQKILPGICDPICAHQCVHGCDFRCCVPGYQATHNIPRPPVGVVLPGSCSMTCSPTCFPECTPSCCAGGPKGMFQSSLDLTTLFPTSCPPGCSGACFPFCTPSCCSGASPPPSAAQYALPPPPLPRLPPPPPPQLPPPPQPQQQILQQYAPAQYLPTQNLQQQTPIFSQCGGSCSQACAPSCLTSCCVATQRQRITQQMYPAQPQAPQMVLTPTSQAVQPSARNYAPLSQSFQSNIVHQEMPTVTSTCTAPCSPACAPMCERACCEGLVRRTDPRSQAIPLQHPNLSQNQMLPAAVQVPLVPQAKPALSSTQVTDSLNALNKPLEQQLEQKPANQDTAEIVEGFPDSISTKKALTELPDSKDLLPEDLELKPQVQSPLICPLTCPDMCLPDCTDHCCNGNKAPDTEIDKKSKIAQQLALLRRRRRYIQ